MLASSGLLNDIDDAWAELLNGRNVIGENTHISRLGWNVYLVARNIKYQQSATCFRTDPTALHLIHPSYPLPPRSTNIWVALHIGRLEDGLYGAISLVQVLRYAIQSRIPVLTTYLMRESQRQLDLVTRSSGLGVSSLEDLDGLWAGLEGGSGDTEGVHFDLTNAGELVSGMVMYARWGRE